MSLYEEKPKRTEQYELADVGTRFVAIIIDGIVLGIISGLLFAFAREPGAAGGFIVGLLYQWYFLTQKDGQTPGKQAMHIRVVKVSGEPLDW